MKIKIFLLPIVAVFALTVGTNAGTTFTITPVGGLPLFTTDQLTLAENRFNQYVDGFFSENERIFPSALAMANTLGYPIGKSTIGSFPHIQFGVAAGAGILEADRYDDFERENPRTPFMGANVGLHFGLGITEGFDIVAKVFNLGWFYQVDNKWSNDRNNVGYEMKVKDSELLSAGVKFRYNLIQRKTLVPFVFSFGGVNINLGFDYIHGKTAAELMMRDIVTELEVNNISTNPISVTRSEYHSTGNIQWDIFSVTPELLIYSDFLYFLSIYTGPGVSFNFGRLDFQMKGTGFIQTDESIDLPGGASPDIPINTEMASIEFESDYTMKPYRMIPKWTVGIEINILMVKLNVEAVSILTSPKDSWMVQFGTRVHL